MIFVWGFWGILVRLDYVDYTHVWAFVGDKLRELRVRPWPLALQFGGTYFGPIYITEAGFWHVAQARV